MRRIGVSLALCLAACAPQTRSTPEHYRTTASPLSLSSRVQTLLDQMTLEEKVGQLLLIDSLRVSGPALYDSGLPFDPHWMQVVFEQTHTGSIVTGSGFNPDATTAAELAAYTNALQAYAIEHSRLGIPILYGLDAVHGHNAVEGATLFPHNIGLAATRDAQLVEDLAAATARTARATGVSWTYGPVSDLGKDPRWGRFYETFGEDRVLGSELVAASVRGYQGSPSAPLLAACAKHFVGYGSAATGLDRADAEISWRTLQDQHLLPFQAAVDAGVKTVMATAGSVNGVPVSASHQLLTDILRGQLGFEGLIVSDWRVPEGLFDSQNTAADVTEGYEQTLLAGVDMLMVPDNPVEAYNTVLGLIEDGRVPLSRIDDAVSRVLLLKEELGLFDDPFVDVPSTPAASAVTPPAAPTEAEQTPPAAPLSSDRALARRAALESLVLLSNDGALPLRPSARVLLTGPAADDVAIQMGGWTLGWQGITRGYLPAAVTVRQALSARLGSDGFAFAPGAPAPGINDPALAAQYRSQALALAADADVAVVVAGEAPYAESLGDNPADDLPIEQRDLILALSDAGIPVVLVLVAGRPLIVEPLVERSAAFMMAHLPGTEGGNAIADALLGLANPSGRLPYSWPRHAGQIPLHYDERQGINPDDPQRNRPLYDPLFVFGSGLSYTRPEHFSLTVSDRELAPEDTMTVWMEALNPARAPIDDVVELYVARQQRSQLTAPVQLVAFERIHLEPYDHKTIELRLPISRLATTPGDVFSVQPRAVEPGEYTLYTPGGQIAFRVRPPELGAENN
jgi:beta-glucosidase